MQKPKSDAQIWTGVAVGVAVFIGLMFVTDPLHDWLFLSHTSIQDDVSTCSGGRYGECVTEDGVRAYDSGFWAFLGNSFALLTTLIRAGVGYLAYYVIVNWIRWK